MTLADIYAAYTTGSAGFVIAVETHGGFDISRTEIERIAASAATAEEFQTAWEDTTDWADDEQ